MTYDQAFLISCDGEPQSATCELFADELTLGTRQRWHRQTQYIFQDKVNCSLVSRLSRPLDIESRATIEKEYPAVNLSSNPHKEVQELLTGRYRRPHDPAASTALQLATN
ncbi:hypothetical protein EYF80_054755 [Liparis tanakae]|uniref:Uncharacterized protein n=1 Tax=Liparis tanakae TaxID=230148 RepID=A0A4Z2F1J8_9TELE|nr:hypothetical protein EYF80_054755 [Liparis tanakae]